MSFFFVFIGFKNSDIFLTASEKGNYCFKLKETFHQKRNRKIKGKIYSLQQNKLKKVIRCV